MCSSALLNQIHSYIQRGLHTYILYTMVLIKIITYYSDMDTIEVVCDNKYMLLVYQNRVRNVGDL